MPPSKKKRKCAKEQRELDLQNYKTNTSYTPEKKVTRDGKTHHLFTVINGVPRPLYRTAFAAKKKGAPPVIYNNRSGYCDSMKKCLKEVVDHVKWPNLEDLEGSSVSMDLKFVFPRPLEHMRMERRKQKIPYYVTKVPDIDNLVKLVLDAMTGIVYGDDKCVVEVHAEKIYTRRDSFSNEFHENIPKTVISLTSSKATGEFKILEDYLD